ncbi:penicillin-binding transpeptidase domain-containing protein [Nitrincola sp. A-D6]|uniref:penicillin-binding transpeptidase domain-containing protein n=1 Tax=Nitrincola sp. A-D6 TaxID=1545442 RepID=UPI001F3E6EA8|nr:penicillin-binding transpeptidase domain-containing protein [Nitrincola sp. A-D6]
MELLGEYPLHANMHPALVINTSEQEATIMLRDGSEHQLSWDAMKWARAYRSVNAMGPAPQTATDVLTAGDIIRVAPHDDYTWHLTQLPRVQGGVIAMESDTGAIRALSGGFSFTHNKFNRVTQAFRQPGSTFKPFLYAVALENNYTAASVINDSPIVIHDVSLAGEWRPENHSRDFEGPIRLREALYRSKNLVSIRLMRDVGVNTAHQHILKFGFDPQRTPANLSLALGSADATPIQINTGYATFANGGYLVSPGILMKSMLTAYRYSSPIMPETHSKPPIHALITVNPKTTVLSKHQQPLLLMTFLPMLFVGVQDVGPKF